MPPADLIPVPEAVQEVARQALAHRAANEEVNGTARGLVIGTALVTGFVRPWELAELREWHDVHPGDVRDGGACTVVAGLYGGGPGRAWDEPVTAAARTPLAQRLAKLSRTVTQADQRLRTRIHAAAETALAEALRQAGVKLTTKARSQTAKRAVRAALDAGQVGGAVLAAVGVTEQELLDRRFDTLAALVAAWIAATERRKLSALAVALGIDASSYDAEVDARADAAAGFLAAGLGLLARQALSGTTAQLQVGEQSGPIPYRLVRDTWTIGATRTHPPALREGGPGAAGVLPRVTDAGPSIVDEVLAASDVGPTRTVKTWQVGDPDRPFEPHQSLDGTTWDTEDYPPELAADAGDWPYVDVYEPGDHDGCLCEISEDWVPAIEPEGGDLAEGIGAGPMERRDLASVSP